MTTRLPRAFAGAVLGIIAFASSACVPGNGGASPTPATKTTAAPIERLDVLTRESSPPGYTLYIVSGLPSGCARFHSAEVTGRAGATITVVVLNTVPADPRTECTAIYGYHEANLDLGQDFTPGTTYTVNVNDKTTTFRAQ